jgi:GDP-L-fucose synthase
VLPALIRRFHEARESGAAEVAAWGTGAPRREFLHVDDLADACAFLLGRDEPPDWINVGTGTDVTIRELTEMVAQATGYKGRVSWDATKPDGTPRKLLDVSRMSALGWKARTGLKAGIEATYLSFLGEKKSGKLRE